MNRKLTFSGGEPSINFDDLDRNNIANLNALTASFRAYGDNYIIQGVTGTTPVTAGYIMLDGEILQVDAHAPSSTHFAKVVTYDSGGDKTFNDATPRQTWQKNRATISAGSGNLAYADAPRLVNFGSVDIGTTTNIATTINIDNLANPGLIQRVDATSGGLLLSKIVLTIPPSVGQRLILQVIDASNTFNISTLSSTLDGIRDNADSAGTTSIITAGQTIELVRDYDGMWRLLSKSPL